MEIVGIIAIYEMPTSCFTERGRPILRRINGGECTRRSVDYLKADNSSERILIGFLMATESDTFVQKQFVRHCLYFKHVTPRTRKLLRQKSPIKSKNEILI